MREEKKIKKISDTENCIGCNNLFVISGPNHKFCTKECRFSQLKRFRTKKVCISCNNTFIPNGNFQKYCDKKCRPAPIKKLTAPHPPKVCIFCNKFFAPKRPKRQKYCSQKCVISARKKPFKEIVCKQCGIVFKPTGNQSRFCSIKCRDLAYEPVKKMNTTNQKLKKYGLSKKDYQALILQQDNCCAICHQIETRMVNGKLSRLAIDHCHRTGVVRGLLCFQCNVGIGYFNDNWALLDNALEYLTRGDLKAGINQRMGSRNVNA